jgi:hypothetical protein
LENSSHLIGPWDNDGCGGVGSIDTIIVKSSGWIGKKNKGGL